MFHLQSLAERAQARTGLPRGTVNAHAEATAAREAKLQAEVTAARETQRIKEAMARQAFKDADDLKRKLEDAERKAKACKDADLQAVVEGMLSSLVWADSVFFYKVFVTTSRPWSTAGARQTEEALKKQLATLKSLLTSIKEKSTETRQG
jgi:ferredoxin-NADP reductase